MNKVVFMRVILVITIIILFISMGFFIKTYKDYDYNKSKLDNLNNNVAKVEKDNKELDDKISSIYKDNEEYTKKVEELEVWKKEITKVKK